MHRHLAWLCAATVVFAACSKGNSVVPTPALKAQAAYHQGNAKLVAGDFKAALVLLRRSVRLDPGLVQAHQALGETYLGLLRGPEAEEQFRLALKIQPKKYLAWEGLGDALRLEHQLDKALDAYAHAATLDQTLPDPWTSQGEVLRDQDAYADAAAAFEKAAARASGKDVATQWTSAGGAWGKAGKWDRAAANLAKAAAATPKAASAWDRLGQARAHAGDMKGVATAYARAVAVSPEDPVLWELLGAARRALGDAAGARKAYERARDLAPHRASVWEGLGRLDLDAKDLPAATRDAHRALDALGSTGPSQGKKGAAVAAEVEDDNVVANVANLLAKVGDHDRAAGLYRMLLGGKGDHDPQLWIALAHEDTALGDKAAVALDCATARKDAGTQALTGLEVCPKAPKPSPGKSPGK